MKRKCIICGHKFSLSKTEINLIINKEVGPDDIVICDHCADMAYELAETEEYINYYQMNEL